MVCPWVGSHRISSILTLRKNHLVGRFRKSNSSYHRTPARFLSTPATASHAANVLLYLSSPSSLTASRSSWPAPHSQHRTDLNTSKSSFLHSGRWAPDSRAWTYSKYAGMMLAISQSRKPVTASVSGSTRMFRSDKPPAQEQGDPNHLGQCWASGVPGWRVRMRPVLLGSMTTQMTRGIQGPRMEQTSTVMLMVEGEWVKNWRATLGMVGPGNRGRLGREAQVS